MTNNEQKITLADQLHSFIKSDLYIALIQPIHDEIESLKASYECKDLGELKTLKGYRKGLDKIFQIMYQIDTEAETARADIKAEQERALRNKAPEDSSDL